MRKKLLFGMIALTAICAVAGERYFNRANGQDIPLPRAPESEKNDLFNLLKKDLEAKKDEPLVLPSLPTSKEDKVLIAPSPIVDAPKPLIPPVVSDKKPEAAKQDLALPPLQDRKDAAPSFPAPVGTKADQAPALPPVNNKDTSEKPLSKPTTDGLPPLAPLNPPPAYDPFKIDSKTPQTIPADFPPTTADVKPNTAPIAVSLPKNSPWSLNVVMVDGQTIVTAIVNKKHEFKILCQTLDLQTGKGTLKASGKVQINGDALNGICEHLSIMLMEDRLLLEGGAQVSIDRTSANVSDTKPASFELRCETLNLRISELQTARADDWQRLDIYPRPVDGVRTSRGDATNRVVTASMKLEGTQWTPYGRLRLVKSNDSMWSLEGSDGAVIAYLLAHEGKSLHQYVGRNISVYGTREGAHAGQSVLRVTHIALP